MSLQELRTHIDQIDDQIINLLVVRNEVVTQVGKQKELLSLPTLQTDREEEVLERLKSLATQKGLNQKFVTKLFTQIIEESKRIQDEQKR